MHVVVKGHFGCPSAGYPAAECVCQAAGNITQHVAAVPGTRLVQPEVGMQVPVLGLSACRREKLMCRCSGFHSLTSELHIT